MFNKHWRKVPNGVRRGKWVPATLQPRPIASGKIVFNQVSEATHCTLSPGAQDLSLGRKQNYILPGALRLCVYKHSLGWWRPGCDPAGGFLGVKLRTVPHIPPPDSPWGGQAGLRGWGVGRTSGHGLPRQASRGGGAGGRRTPQPPSLQRGKVKPQTNRRRLSPGWAARVAGAEVHALGIAEPPNVRNVLEERAGKGNGCREVPCPRPRDTLREIGEERSIWGRN